MDGDEERDDEDFNAMVDELVALDGSLFDADSEARAVEIVGFGPRFSVADLDGDGRIDDVDLALAQPCRADIAAPIGTLDGADTLAAFEATGLEIDFDLHGSVNFFDAIWFLRDYGEGCPDNN